MTDLQVAKKLNIFFKLDYLWEFWISFNNSHVLSPILTTPHGSPNREAVNGSNSHTRIIHFSHFFKGNGCCHMKIKTHYIQWLRYNIWQKNIHLMWVMWPLMHVPSFDHICYTTIILKCDTHAFDITLICKVLLFSLPNVIMRANHFFPAL